MRTVFTHILGLILFFITAPTLANATCDSVSIGSFQVYPNAALSPDGRFTFVYDGDAMARNGGLNVSITNIESMKTVQLKTKAQLDIQGASQDLSQFLLAKPLGDHSDFYIYDGDGKEIASFKLPDTNEQEEFITKADYNVLMKRWLISTNRRVFAFHVSKRKLNVIYDLQSKENVYLEWFNNFDKTNSFTYSSTGNLILLTTHITASGQLISTLKLFNPTDFSLANEIEIPGQYLPLQVDPDYLLFQQPSTSSLDDNYKLLNVNTGESKSFQLVASANAFFHYDKQVFRGPKNTFVSITTEGTIKLYGINQQLIREINIPYLNQWTLVSSIMSQSGKLLLLHKDGVTPYSFDFESQQLSRLPQFMNFLFKNQSRPVVGNKIVTLLFDERLTKYSLFIYELSSQCAKEIPSIKNAAEFKELLQKNPMTAFAYVENFYQAARAVLNTDKFVALPKAERDDWKEIVKAFLKNYLSIENSASPKKSFQRISTWLSVFEPILKNFTADETESMLDTIAIALSEKLSKEPQLSEISVSKLANIFIVNLAPFFGMHTEPRTDFVLLKDLMKDPSGKTIQPVILGSSPITEENGATLLNVDRDDGFYLKRDLSPIILNTGDAKNFESRWKFENKVWQAKGQAQLLSLSHLINKEPSPKYRQLWGDKKLTGLILISPNLGEPLWLVRKYLNYFKDQGFDFGPNKIVWAKNITLTGALKENYLFPKNILETSNLKDWFKDLIANGTLDYWIKEAHSGGSNDLIFIGKKNQILKGVRKLSDGQEENIYIAYTSGESFSKDDQIAISNEEFADWIRVRENTSTEQQLIYINASCWSSTKARQEIIAARSPLLVEIPTGAASLTFQNSNNNHLQILLTSLRESLDYNQIQKKLDAVKASDGTKNPYLLPNQQAYKKAIWDGLNSALDYSVKLENL